jgi:hypothetical protein
VAGLASGLAVGLFAGGGVTGLAGAGCCACLAAGGGVAGLASGLAVGLFAGGGVTGFAGAGCAAGCDG